MQKIMFNDRYHLTRMAVKGVKTNTRRIEGDRQFQLAATAAEDFTYEEATGCVVMCCQGIEIFRHKCRYKVGEIVAVAQSYRDIFKGMKQDDSRRAKYADEKYTPGYGNKMYVRADMMIEHIRIKGVRCERLQDISDEDCMKEGVVAMADFKTRGCSRKLFALPRCEYAQIFNTPRRAFAALIDKVSGRRTWDRNPWVVVYEFELVK